MKTSLPSLFLLLTLSAGSVAAQTVFTASSWVPPTHPLSVAQKEWCDLLAKESAGRMKCNILPKAVSSPPGTFDAVRDGLADVSFTVHGYTPGRFTVTQIAEMPFLGNSAQATSVAYQRIFDRHLRVANEHQGVQVLGVFTHGPGVAFNTKRPLTKLADTQGLKFRVGGGVINDISKLLGLNATLKPATETFELLSGGVMDATLLPIEGPLTFKLDMVKHATVFPGGLYNSSFVFLMNEASYKRLSAQDKAVVDKLSGEVASAIFGKAWDQVEPQARAYMQDKHIQLVSAPAPFVEEIRNRIKPLEDQWADAAQAKGVKQARTVMAEFRSEAVKLDKN